MSNINFEKKEFDIENIRKRNFKKLNEMIKEYNAIEGIYAKVKTSIVRKYQDDEELTIDQKDEKINKEFEVVNNSIYHDKKNIVNKIKKEIEKQSKWLLILETPKEKYDYYMQIVNNPIDNEFFREIESNIYREFLLRNPSIDNIIISYSELENNKKTNKSEDNKPKIIEKNKELKENKESKENKEPKENKETEDKKESKEDKKDKNHIEMFLDLLNKLSETIKKQETLNADDLAMLVSLFNYLPADKKSKYGKALSKIIYYNDLQVQDEYKKEVAEKEFEQIPLVNRLIEFFGKPAKWLIKGFGSFANITRKITGKRLINKIKKAFDANKEDKKEKYENQFLERNITSGVRFYGAKNKLAKIKPKLYKEGYDGLTKLEKKAFFNSKILVANKFYDDLSFEEALTSRKNFLNVISQCLEEQSLTEIKDDKGYYTDLDNILPLIDKAYEKKLISNAEMQSFKREFNAISLYRMNADKKNNDNEPSIYEVDNESIKKALRYYESPITYVDGDKEVILPYVKRR